MAYCNIAPLTGFADLEARYNSTKPAKQRCEDGLRVEHDIRPIDPKRTNRCDHIIKFDDDCYGVIAADGYGYSGRDESKLSRESLIHSTAVILERRGSLEILTISVRDRYVNADNNLIKRLAPYGFRLVTANGQSSVIYQGKEYGIRRHKATRIADPASVNYVQELYQRIDVGMPVKFARVSEGDNPWIFCGEELVKKQVKRVDKKIKEPYAAGVRALKEWAQVPLMLIHDQIRQAVQQGNYNDRWQFSLATTKALIMWLREHTEGVPGAIFGKSVISITRNMDGLRTYQFSNEEYEDSGEPLVVVTALREMLLSFGTDDIEEKYQDLALHMLEFFVTNVDTRNYRVDNSTAELTNSRLNAFINKHAAFYSIVEVD